VGNVGTVFLQITFTINMTLSQALLDSFLSLFHEGRAKSVEDPKSKENHRGYHSCMGCSPVSALWRSLIGSV